MKIREFEKACRLLSARKRLEILKLLLGGRSMSVGEIALAINLSFKSTSKHLLLLSQGDFLERQQDRYSGLYRLSSDLPEYLRTLIKLLAKCH